MRQIFLLNADCGVLVFLLLLFSIFSFFRQVIMSSHYKCLLTSYKERSHRSCHWHRKLWRNVWPLIFKKTKQQNQQKNPLPSREGLPFIVSFLCFFLFLFSVFFFLCSDVFSNPEFLKKQTFIAYFISQVSPCFGRTVCFLLPGDSQRAWGQFVQGCHSEKAPTGKIYPGKPITLWFLIQNLSKLSLEEKNEDI